MEADLKIQRFGKDIYYKDQNNKPLNGYYKIADSRGNYSDINFKNGKKDGKNTDYDYAGRKIKTTTYKNGKNEGTYTTYHQNGKVETVGEFVNGEQEGKWISYDNKGQTTYIQYYKAGKREGKWEAFDKSGKLRAIENYSNGQKTGKWWSKKYYPQLQTYSYETEHYKNNKRVGYAEDKREDGTLKWKRNYVDNYTYTHKSYHPNGKLELSYNLVDSKYDKELVKYDANGNIIKKVLYDNGNIVKSAEEFARENRKPTIKITRGAKPKQSSNSVKEKITDFNYKALLISNENYNSGVGKLDFPTDDAEKLINVLVNNYSFDTEDIIHLKDASRFDIINTLDNLAAELTTKDNLLIFYAGHGVFDEKLNKGYWLPVDADASRKNNWVSNSDIRDYISAFDTQHTLLITDACFSGSIFEYKQRSLNTTEKAVTEKLLSKKSRKAMTSGLNKTVPDKSIFIKYLIKNLQENTKSYLRAGELYNDIREAVMANTDNNPQFEVIKNTSHEGGEFIFLKKD